MSRHIPISYSRVSDYEQCPRKFESKYVRKNYPDDSGNPAFAKGNKIHEDLERMGKAMVGGQNKPDNLSEEAIKMIPMLVSVVKNYDQIMFEQQIAVSKDMQRTSWFDNNATYARVIADLLAFRGNEALIIDWKSGKFREYDDKETGQLHMSSAVIMALFPKVEVVHNAYVFVEHNKTIKRTFTRDQVEALLAPFEKVYEKICTDTEWHPQQNQYCGWCHVPGCEFAK